MGATDAMGLVWETGRQFRWPVKPNQTMKTITFESNYAAFAYRLTAEVGEEVNEASTALCLEGLANISYRVAGSAVDKALGVKSKKNGGMGREGVSYDQALGETINAAVSAKIVELENAEGSRLKALNLSFAVTGEYVTQSDGTASKEATELWVKVQALKTTVDKNGVISHPFANAMRKLGFTVVEGDLGEAPLVGDYDDDAGIAACRKHIQAEKAKAKLAATASLVG